ncbi:perlucin-like protein [Patiria miniata]|uniref:C-type lectin domain-containing protein n=1 Tax=Patiria miniata TaxID=46514 RepID=A0A913Z469_PATMI|nr:perlucin-like protein [Patiria miniata]
MNRLLLVCVFLVAATAAVSAGCSPGYKQRQGGNCYKLYGPNWEWWQYADHICSADGAWLVTIRSEADSVWVNNFFADNRRHMCPDWYWIGATDMAHEGTWRWTEDGSLLDYVNWMSGAPNNDGDEDAVEVYSGTRKWNDNKTSGVWSSKICFICEKKPN